MNADRWQRTKQIVGDALEVAAAGRASFVRTACGDDAELLAEVESILSESGERIEAFADDLDCSLGVMPADASAPGQRLGAYAIEREIGRGGMGTVYLACRADEQFHKEVAIKILKRGTDTEEVLRRFRAEREILARLEHPHIARLLDAGTTEEGLPYFVMEYVEGTPITDFCAARKLDVRERLQLFLHICGAIQFAHQRLIVHRDIKPGNILVTVEGEPKLLDFGIAKLLDTSDAIAAVTIVEQQRFTPNYASPEQVRGEVITTVSDVYAIGALLYELLVGTPPHRFASAQPSPTELFRVVTEEEPLRPSTAVADPAMQKRLRGDLDNILLQALRKEPARRYQGVNALAEDLRRHLNNFPVRARKDSVRYRASKFIRRHRAGVAAAAAVVLALLGGITVAVSQARIARMERAKAVDRFNQVRELARSVMFDYHDQIAVLPGSTAVRQTLVRDALKYLDNLAREAGDDRGLQRELADAYEKVAAVQGGVATSNVGTALVAANLGDSKGAIATQERAIAIREQLVATGANQPDDLRKLAGAYSQMGSFFLSTGPPERAIEYAQKAIPIAESLLSANPASEEVLSLLAQLYLGTAKVLGSPAGPNVGDTRAALSYTQAALRLQQALVNDYPGNFGYQQGLAVTHNTLGLIYSAIGERQEQLAQYRDALAVNRALVASHADNALYRRELAVQLGNVGSTLRQLNDTAGALAHFFEALTIYDALAAADLNDVALRRQWAVAHRNVAVAVGAGDRLRAEQHFQKALAVLAEIAAKDPKNADFRRQWAFTYLAKSRFQLETAEPEAAVASALEGVRIDDELVAASPADAAAQNTLALLFTQLGASYAKWAATEPAAQDRWRNARDAYASALAVYERLKANGKLNGADAAKPDELAREIANCDAALSSSAKPASSG